MAGNAIGIMRLHYYSETDSLYIDLSEKESSYSKEITEGLVVDFDDNGNIVGIDVDHASQKLNLQTLETTALPLTTASLRG